MDLEAGLNPVVDAADAAADDSGKELRPAPTRVGKLHRFYRFTYTNL